LSKDPREFDLTRYQEYQFGEEQPFPLSRRQMLYLKYRYKVYFPWQVFYETIPTLNWADKSSGVGKSFTPEARRHFPKTISGSLDCVSATLHAVYNSTPELWEVWF
jgi:hypothetical protein